jgi:hypothetical protein
MCPVCLATVGLYVAGGASAGGITTYLATRLLRRGRDQHSEDRLLGLQASKLPDAGGGHDGRQMEA